MKLNYHNKIEIQTSKKHFEFFNTMLDSIYTKIANLESFCDKIAIGNGIYEEISSNTIYLCNHIQSFSLSTESLQNNISNSELFIKKIVTIETKNINSNYITEAGITSNSDDSTNPIIYNYFSFINNDNPNGIEISSGDPIIISIYIYLNLSTDSIGLFTKGKNSFINFLLGDGTNGKLVYVARGEDNSENVLIERTNDYVGEKYLCAFSSTINNGVLLTFEGDLGAGETNELVFLLGDEIFARINTLVLQDEYSTTENFSPKTNYVVDLGTGVTSVDTIINDSLTTEETEVFVVKYATNFASKISLPFNNLFDVDTPRFLSRDGDKIIFLLNDYIYMYQNEDYKVNHKFSINLQIQDIVKISCFEKYFFVFSKNSPYVFPYIIENNTLTACSIDLSSFEYFDYMADFIDIDIVQAKNGYFLLGFYAPYNTTTAYTLYYTFNESNKSFIYDSYLSAPNYSFSYLLPFYKNNFSDGQIMYLQAGEKSSLCKRSIHKADKTITNTYSSTSYYLTYLTTNIYVKSRAVICEKDFTPNFWVYYFPQIYRFNLSQFSEAVKSYISTNLLYLVQKLPDGSFRAYNLVGYDSPQEFSNGIPSEIDQSKILFVEFLIDTILFFMDDENEPIIAYSLNINGTCIENVSDKSATYTVTLTRKNTLGNNNEGVIAKLAINVSIWYFQHK